MAYRGAAWTGGYSKNIPLGIFFIQPLRRYVGADYGFSNNLPFVHVAPVRLEGNNTNPQIE